MDGVVSKPRPNRRLRSSSLAGPPGHDSAERQGQRAVTHARSYNRRKAPSEQALTPEQDSRNGSAAQVRRLTNRKTCRT